MLNALAVNVIIIWIIFESEETTVLDVIALAVNVIILHLWFRLGWATIKHGLKTHKRWSSYIIFEKRHSVGRTGKLVFKNFKSNCQSPSWIQCE